MRSRESRRGLSGHGRRSLGLGERDPRGRRDAEALQGEAFVERGKGLRMNERGKVEVDLDTVAREVAKRMGRNA